MTVSVSAVDVLHEMYILKEIPLEFSKLVIVIDSFGKRITRILNS